MRTEDLIAALGQSAEATPARPLAPARLGAQVGAVVALVVGLFLTVLGPRAGLGTVIAEPLVATKTALPCVLALIGFPLAFGSLRPEARGARIWLFALPALAAAGLWAVSYTTTAPQARFADVWLGSVAECLGLIVLLSALPAWVALRLARRGAPQHPARSGALIGLAVSAAAATGYSFFCTQDNPLFYLTWYGAAMAVVTLASARLGARWLGW